MGCTEYLPQLDTPRGRSIIYNMYIYIYIYTIIIAPYVYIYICRESIYILYCTIYIYKENMNVSGSKNSILILLSDIQHKTPTHPWESSDLSVFFSVHYCCWTSAEWSSPHGEEHQSAQHDENQIVIRTDLSRFTSNRCAALEKSTNIMLGFCSP